MKKIMFNDKYGLTTAVLNGRKTMTRRIIPRKILDNSLIVMEAILKAPYKEGEVVAIAQSYKDVCFTHCKWLTLQSFDLGKQLGELQKGKGWNNKMFVKAELMPHNIRITDIKVERLQDISDNDCIAEGIKCFPSDVMPDLYTFEGVSENWKTAHEAFAHLIDKVSGKGTWESNPWVFVYSFELID